MMTFMDMFLLVVLCISLSSFPTFAQKEGDIRLISGRLEVFYSRVWGTVCDDYFDDIDAQVACRQLGHNSGISLGNTVDDGTGIIWLDDMNCTGNERALAGCRHRGWGAKNCKHSEDVGIECLDLNEGDIRLTLGRLEILYYGTWGTVCDDNFDDIDAQVACRQLGYNNGIFVGSTVKSVKGRIWLDNLNCSGDENKLSLCPHAGWGIENCFRGENVKIKCNNKSEGDVRLSSGRLEILYNNEWGTVCSDNFDSIDAQVACKQLGYRKGIVLGKMEATNPLRIWLDKLECKGWENKLIDCSHTDWGNHTCRNDSAVRIRCHEGQGDVRIKSRRLEIHYNGTWGTVCDDNFDDRDATVACRQLGYNSGISLGATVGYGIERIWLDNLLCSGNERTLGDCPSSGWGVEDCSHAEDVGIKCLNSNDGDIRLITRDQLQIFYHNEWGTVCREDFGKTGATVACRQLGYRYGKVWGYYTGYVDAKTWLTEVSCTGRESNLLSCRHAGMGENDCRYPVAITCSNSSVPNKGKTLSFETSILLVPGLLVGGTVIVGLVWYYVELFKRRRRNAGGILASRIIRIGSSTDIPSRAHHYNMSNDADRRNTERATDRPFEAHHHNRSNEADRRMSGRTTNRPSDAPNDNASNDADGNEGNSGCCTRCWKTVKCSSQQVYKETSV